MLAVSEQDDDGAICVYLLNEDVDCWRAVDARYFEQAGAMPGAMPSG